MVVQPKEPQEAPPIVETGVFEIAGPVINGVTVQTATEGETVTLSGALFGTTRPKIYLEYTTAKGTKRKSCKVTSRPGTPEAGTGAGEIQVIIPKGVPAGAPSGHERPLAIRGVCCPWNPDRWKRQHVWIISVVHGFPSAFSGRQGSLLAVRYESDA